MHGERGIVRSYARSILESDGVVEARRGQDIKGHQDPDMVSPPDSVVGH